MPDKIANIANLITRLPAADSGLHVITGTSTLVMTIAEMHKDGMEPHWIAFYRNLTMAQVYAALAYYSANTDEVTGALEAHKKRLKEQEKEERRLRREKRQAKE